MNEKQWGATPGTGRRGALQHLPGIIFLAGIVVLAASCASTNVYNVDLNYLPTHEAPALKATLGPAITVALFSDERAVDDTMIMGRVIEIDGSPSPVLPRHREPSRAVMDALSSFLTQAGYTLAARNPSWNLQEETIDPAWGPILLGGTINDLFIKVDRSKPLRTYSSRVSLTFVLADGTNMKILHRVTVDTAPARQYLRFSEIRMEEELSNALSHALERAFIESELPDRINRLREERRE